MSPPRTPAAIQADIRALHSTASLNFVPLKVSAALELQLEFNEAVAAGMEHFAAVLVAAAGVTPAAEGGSSNQPNG